MKIALSTDTSCTISKELAKKCNIHIFPLNVIVDGQEFLDGETITQDELLIEMKNNKVIKTSTPPPGDIINYFNKLFDEKYDYIIHFTISSKLSSMNSLFNNISKENFDNKIIVIDSYSLSTVMLSHILYTYELIKQEVDPFEIRDIINNRKLDNKIIFVPENLNALKNGGRISPVLAKMLNFIGLKPVLNLTDGKLEKETLTKNVKKLFFEKIKDLSKTYPIEKYDYTIVSFDANQNLIDFVIKEINDTFPNYVVPTFPIAINVCAHCGPGTFGLLISPKFNNHSINDYLD